MTFLPWNVAYPALDTHFAAARLDPAMNHWDVIYDFNAADPAPADAPHYTVATSFNTESRVLTADTFARADAADPDADAAAVAALPAPSNPVAMPASAASAEPEWDAPLGLQDAAATADAEAQDQEQKAAVVAADETAAAADAATTEQKAAIDDDDGELFGLVEAPVGFAAAVPIADDNAAADTNNTGLVITTNAEPAEPDLAAAKMHVHVTSPSHNGRATNSTAFSPNGAGAGDEFDVFSPAAHSTGTGTGRKMLRPSKA